MGTLLLALTLLQTPPARDDIDETVIDIDMKDADVLDVLHLLAEVGEFNLIADPDVSCSLRPRARYRADTGKVPIAEGLRRLRRAYQHAHHYRRRAIEGIRPSILPCSCPPCLREACPHL